MSCNSIYLDKLLTLIPHRHPFLMVDHIVFCDPGNCIEGQVNIGARDKTAWEQTPLLLCESLAQLSKALELSEDPNAQSISFLTSVKIDLSQIKKPRGDIKLVVKRHRSFDAMVSYQVEASLANTTLLKGIITRRVNAP